MGELPADWKAQDRKFFFVKIHSYYWEETFLYKYCADQIIRRCVPEEEQLGILSHFHENACGGHYTMCRGMRQRPKIRENLSLSHDAFEPDFGS